MFSFTTIIISMLLHHMKIGKKFALTINGGDYMPYINIRTKRPDEPLRIKSFSDELAQEMDIDVKRINIIVDYYDEERIFMGSGTEYLIINLWISEDNKKEFLHRIIKTSATLAGKHFNKGGDSIAVICNLIKEGNMFIGNQFK